MDDNPAFLELSVLLTGLPTMVKDKEDKILNGPISDEYLRRLKAVFPGHAGLDPVNRTCCRSPRSPMTRRRRSPPRATTAASFRFSQSTSMHG